MRCATYLTYAGGPIARYGGMRVGGGGEDGGAVVSCAQASRWRNASQQKRSRRGIA